MRRIATDGVMVLINTYLLTGAFTDLVLEAVMIDTFKHLIDPDIYNVDCELTWTRGVPVCM